MHKSPTLEMARRVLELETANYHRAKRRQEDAAETVFRVLAEFPELREFAPRKFQLIAAATQGEK